MYCVYKDTAQRCALSIKSLNTNGSFIIVSDKEKLVFVWEGANASADDQKLALDLGLEVVKRDLNIHDATMDDVVHVVEGNERHALLMEMLRVMGFREADYRSKIARVERSKPLPDNSEIVVGTIERGHDGDFSILTSGHQQPDELGKVPRINFPPILSPSSIIVVQVGEHWDIWVSRGAEREPDLEKDVKAFVTRIVMARNANDPDMNAFFALEYIRIVRQGCERVLFRRHFKIFTDFEPPDRSIPWIPPNATNKDRNAAEEEAEAAKRALFEALSISNGGGAAEQLLDSTDAENHAGMAVDPYMLPVPAFSPVDSKEDDEAAEGERDEEDEEEKEEERKEEAKRTEGRRQCTKDMLEFVESECVQPGDRFRLLEECSLNPRLLMGWQVRLFFFCCFEFL